MEQQKNVQTCLLKLSNKSSSEFSSISTPRLYRPAIGALHARKLLGLGPKLIILRLLKAYIPEYPVGTAEECADMIHEFIPVAKAVYALSNLKII